MANGKRIEASPLAALFVGGGVVLLAAWWLFACDNPAPPAPPAPPPDVSQTATVATVAEEAASPADGAAALPDAVRILGPEYHAAYRLLPNGEWARKYVAQVSDFAAFDYEYWQALDWDEGAGATRVGDAGSGPQELAGGVGASGDDRRWVLERLRELDAAAAARFESAADVSERLEALRALAERGFAWEIEEIAIRYQFAKAGYDDDFIELVVEDARDLFEHLQVTGPLGLKTRIVIQQEWSLCNLLMDMVVGEHPRSVFTDGRCDIAMAAELAQERLSNGGAPARDEASYRAWFEHVEAFEAAQAEPSPQPRWPRALGARPRNG